MVENKDEGNRQRPMAEVDPRFWTLDRGAPEGGTWDQLRVLGN